MPMLTLGSKCNNVSLINVPNAKPVKECINKFFKPPNFPTNKTVKKETTEIIMTVSEPYCNPY